jgi:hypothetical protein
MHNERLYGPKPHHPHAIAFDAIIQYLESQEGFQASIDALRLDLYNWILIGTRI